MEVTFSSEPDIHSRCRKYSIIASNNDPLYMSRILHFFLDKKTNRVCSEFPDHQALFSALEREDSNAIQCLYARVSGGIFNIGKEHGLTDDDIEELIGDCIAFCLLRIREGQYVFQGYNPATFVIEVAKNKAKNRRRSMFRKGVVDLEAAGEPGEEPDFTSFAEVDFLEQLMLQLEPNCQKLIRLKYLEDMRDKEVIELQLTQYTTVDALKNHRSKCFKKLSELAANASIE